MAGSGCGQNAVLADEQLLDTVCSTDLCDQLDDLGVPVTAITTNNQEGACSLVSVVVGRWRCCRGEGLVKLTLDTFWDGLQNAGDKRFTVVGLLEDSGPLSKTRSGGLSACLVCTRPRSLEWHGMEWDKHASKGHHTVRGEAVHNTYVPGFWSVKDAN